MRNKINPGLVRLTQPYDNFSTNTVLQLRRNIGPKAKYAQVDVNGKNRSIPINVLKETTPAILKLANTYVRAVEKLPILQSRIDGIENAKKGKPMPKKGRKGGNC